MRVVCVCVGGGVNEMKRIKEHAHMHARTQIFGVVRHVSA